SRRQSRRSTCTVPQAATEGESHAVEARRRQRGVQTREAVTCATDRQAPTGRERGSSFSLGNRNPGVFLSTICAPVRSTGGSWRPVRFGRNQNSGWYEGRGRPRRTLLGHAPTWDCLGSSAAG